MTGGRRRGEAVLGRRALNRALLARQLLLERRDGGVLETVEHLVGLQAQEPQAPYLGLWTRLARFHPEALSELIATRTAVRGGLMRSTIHLVSADDYVRLWPLMRAVLSATFRGSAFSKAIAGVDTDALLRAGRELLEEAPRTRAELRGPLGERWPEADASSLAHAVCFLTPIVQVPPRGLWRRAGAARWTPADVWLGRDVDGPADAAPIVRRYLAAYGPATVRDIQAWSRLTRLREVVDGLRDELRMFRDEDGAELLDVPGGALPDPGVPAPPRFLPPFDNAILAHEDRRRIIAREHRDAVSSDRLMRTFLVDGFFAGTWRVDGGTLRIVPLAPLSSTDRAALLDEAERMLAFLAPDAGGRDIVVAAA